MIKKIFAFIFFLSLLSCASKKDVLYYQDIKNNNNSSINYVSNEVQVNDILYIKVSALIPDAAEPFNQNNIVSNSLMGDVLRLQGYLVAQDGTIVFPILGTIAVAGKSTLQVQELLLNMIRDNGYVKDPIVSVRIINSKVTILGEVTKPGTYSYDEQNISLNQAIGYAGDLTINAVRKDVLLIREINGTRTYVKLDLTSSDWFTSPYYYVKQNDIIIVNPNGAKIMTSGYLNNIGTTLGILSFGLTIYILLKK